MAKRHKCSFEQVVGYGADPMTMIGAGVRHNVTVLVTVPQLVGGGEVGLAIGDSLYITERCHRIAELLDSATVIIKSGLALSQEIHDGPFWSDSPAMGYGRTSKEAGPIPLRRKRLSVLIWILILRRPG